VNRPTWAWISEWAGQAAQITTGVAGLSYGFGWVLMARFYGSLGVEPEEVGITFTWLVARAFLVGLAALAVLLAARWLQGRATLVRSTDLVLSVGTEVRFAADARAGRPVDFGLLGMSAIRVTPVRLSSADPARPSPAAGCVLRLGGSAGTSLFMVEGRVIRLSDQNVAVSSPC
jgi:hypothetical protein